MSSAATAATPAEQPRRRRARTGIDRRSALYLLVGLLLSAGIPVVATVRILDSNALRNERRSADSALTAQLQQAGDELRGLSDDASTHATDLSNSRPLQRAFLKNDRAAIARIAHKQPGFVFFLHGRRVAGRIPAHALTRSVSLTLNATPFGRVVATIPLNQQLGARLLRASRHASEDRLLIVREGVIVGTAKRIQVEARTVTLGGVRYRGLLTPVPNAPHTKLLALRPQSAIAEAVKPYKQRVLFAALGSFSLLVLVGLLFGGPILRGIGDFRRVASQATTDSLTGLANRWAFDEELALEWRRAERVGDPLALILADIDNFKAVNDRYGHQVGDRVLRKVGEILSANVRQVDLAARYGGEEFAVVVPETDLEGAIQLADRLRAALAGEEIELPDGSRITVTSSFGVAVKGDLPRAEELVAGADEALYAAKRAGKNRVAPELPKDRRPNPVSEPADRRRPRRSP
jgi:diguanylate cyclase (GGDEF)-like protein